MDTVEAEVRQIIYEVQNAVWTSQAEADRWAELAVTRLLEMIRDQP